MSNVQWTSSIPTNKNETDACIHLVSEILRDTLYTGMHEIVLRVIVDRRCIEKVYLKKER